LNRRKDVARAAFSDQSVQKKLDQTSEKEKVMKTKSPRCIMTKRKIAVPYISGKEKGTGTAINRKKNWAYPIRKGGIVEGRRVHRGTRT